jgi:quinol monooxygenase YgiN
MPTIPWRSFDRIDPEHQYLVLLSYLPLKHAGHMPRFMLYTARIVNQLRRSEGLAGYSLRANLISHEFWTLSAWKSEALLRKFVDTVPHAQTMNDLVGKMGPTGFIRWQVTGADLPPDWTDALTRWRGP